MTSKKSQDSLAESASPASAGQPAKCPDCTAEPLKDSNKAYMLWRNTYCDSHVRPQDAWNAGVAFARAEARTQSESPLGSIKYLCGHILPDKNAPKDACWSAEIICNLCEAQSETVPKIACKKCLGTGKQWFHGSRIHGGPSNIGNCTNCDGTGKEKVAARVSTGTGEKS